jgi:hypothetical protein
MGLLTRVCAAVDTVKAKLADLRRASAELAHLSTALGHQAESVVDTASVGTSAGLLSGGGSKYQTSKSAAMLRKQRSRRLTMMAAVTAASAATTATGIGGPTTSVAGAAQQAAGEAASEAVKQAHSMDTRAAVYERRVQLLEQELEYWRSQRDELLRKFPSKERETVLMCISAVRSKGAAQWEASAAVEGYEALARKKLDLHLLSKEHLPQHVRADVEREASGLLLSATLAAAPRSALAAVANMGEPEVLLQSPTSLRDAFAVAWNARLVERQRRNREALLDGVSRRSHGTSTMSSPVPRERAIRTPSKAVPPPVPPGTSDPSLGGTHRDFDDDDDDMPEDGDIVTPLRSIQPPQNPVWALSPASGPSSPSTLSSSHTSDEEIDIA